MVAEVSAQCNEADVEAILSILSRINSVRTSRSPSLRPERFSRQALQGGNHTANTAGARGFMPASGTSPIGAFLKYAVASASRQVKRHKCRAPGRAEKRRELA